MNEADRELIHEVVREALSQTVSIPREDASNIAFAAANKAVQEAHVRLFSQLGYDMANMRDINRLRGNLAFLDTIHLNSRAAGGRVIIATIMILVGAVALALWDGFKVLVAIK